MPRLLIRPARRTRPGGGGGGGPDDDGAAAARHQTHPIQNGHPTAHANPNPGRLCSRQTLATLAVGIFIGYLILPIFMVSKIGLDDVVGRLEQSSGGRDGGGDRPRPAAGGYGVVPPMSVPPSSDRQRFRGAPGPGTGPEVSSRSLANDDNNSSEEDEHEPDDRAGAKMRSKKVVRPVKMGGEGGTKRDESDEGAAPGRDEGSSADDDTDVVGLRTHQEPMSEAEIRFQENQHVLATQSVPTKTTPYVMKTLQLPDSKRLKVLVTGGAGFVGSHLVDKLMMEGHEVIVLDNFFTGQKRNVEHWLHHPNFSLVTHDVTEPIMLEVDQIYHLACPASPPHYQYNPVKTIKTSTMGTINMLGLAKRVKARMLLTSTSEIYGDPQVHPQPESYWGNVNTIGPRSCYDEGKRVAETMMYSYRNQNNVEVRVARIFNTFGPRMHPNDGRVVSNFIIQALQGKDITIYGEGKQTRSFQYVSDLVEGLHRLMNGDYDGPVNLGNPDEYSVKEFAEYIKDMTKSKSKIEYLPKSTDDPSQRRPNITTAKEKIGWQPRIKVRDGLKEAIRYFKSVLDESGEIIPTGPGAAKPKKAEE